MLLAEHNKNYLIYTDIEIAIVYTYIPINVYAFAFFS